MLNDVIFLEIDFVKIVLLIHDRGTRDEARFLDLWVFGMLVYISRF